MAANTDGVGCRDAALSTLLLLGFGAAFFAVGLVLINRDACAGLCDDLGLTLLYAGGPVSALFGVLTDSVVIAWPLDVTLWVVLGFVIARVSGNRGSSPLAMALLVMAASLAFGLVLSRFVELTV